MAQLLLPIAAIQNSQQQQQQNHQSSSSPQSNPQTPSNLEELSKLSIPPPTMDQYETVLHENNVIYHVKELLQQFLVSRTTITLYNSKMIYHFGSTIATNNAYLAYGIKSKCYKKKLQLTMY